MKGRAALFGEDDPTLFNFARNLGLVFEWQTHYEKAAEHYKSWLYTARKHEMGVQSQVLQQAMDDHLKRWAEAVERGDLVLENANPGLIEKCKHWYWLNSRALSVVSLFFLLFLCYLMMVIFTS
jgi:hypothetical protein